MGFMRYIKEQYSEYKKIKNTSNERRNKIQEYLNLDINGLKELTDNDLYTAVIFRIRHALDIKEGKNISLEQKLVYSLDIYEKEVNNGGLCQFFVNTSRLAAPFISNYLKIIKAKEHKKLFDEFVKKNNINLDNLIDENNDNAMEEYEKLKNKYPFNEFDKSFYRLSPIYGHLIDYIKKNIDKF